LNEGYWSLLRVNVFITQLSAERLWEVDRPLPAQVQIAVNINILDLERRSDSILEAPFVFAVAFTPSIAQINIRGRAQITGEKDEVGRVLEEHKQQKPIPMIIVQTISNAAMAESIILSRTIGVPPPLPPLPTPPGPDQTKPDTRYAT